MIEALMIWNEPNNLSHWSFEFDPGWRIYAEMTRCAAAESRKLNPDLKIVLGGISPIDPHFIKLLAGYGVLDVVDIVAIHGFPIDWNGWDINEWPKKIEEIRAVTNLPVWVTEVGVSSFGAQEVQLFGIQRTAELLLNRVERVHWYSLLDLPRAWEPAVNGEHIIENIYQRHYCMGLLGEDGRPKLAASAFPQGMGICQWFHFRDPRLYTAVYWLRRLGVRYLRTGLAWSDWFRPGAEQWFDEQMEGLQDFDTTLTLCFTPEDRGLIPTDASPLVPRHTSPPKSIDDFIDFARWVVQRYTMTSSNKAAVRLPQAFYAR